MKIALAAVLAIVLIVLGVQIYSFFWQEHALSADLADVQTRLTKAKSDEADLQEEVQYLADPVNLQKELRARFNYKKPGETMIVIVPNSPTSTTSTSGTPGTD